MPNWMRQALEIRGKFEDVDNFLKRIGEGRESEREDHLFIDFDRLIPQPKDIYNGPIGKDERIMLEKTKRPDWYTWNTKNWGTKWNAAWQELKYTKDGTTVLMFETAWSLPVPIYNALLQLIRKDFPNITLYGEYLEESYDCGGCLFFSDKVDELHEININYLVGQDNEVINAFTDQEGNEFEFKYV